MTIISVCCVCGIQYGTKEPNSPGNAISHGFCQRHFDEAMANLDRQFAELPEDRSHVEAWRFRRSRRGRNAGFPAPPRSRVGPRRGSGFE